MQIRKVVLASVPLLVAGFLYAGCDSAGDAGGRVIVRITDAPVDASAINVSIVRCEIINSETDEREVLDSTDPAKSFNLLEFQGGATIDVCDKNVTLTAFDQLRIVIGEGAEIVFGEEPDAVVHPLHVASGTSSGLKFFFESPVDVPTENDVFDITLDFVAEESVVTTGPPSAPTGYVMTPVVRVVTATWNEVQVEVSGETTPAAGA